MVVINGLFKDNVIGNKFGFKLVVVGVYYYDVIWDIVLVLESLVGGLNIMGVFLDNINI